MGGRAQIAADGGCDAVAGDEQETRCAQRLVHRSKLGALVGGAVDPPRPMSINGISSRITRTIRAVRIRRVNRVT